MAGGGRGNPRETVKNAGVGTRGPINPTNCTTHLRYTEHAVISICNIVVNIKTYPLYPKSSIIHHLAKKFELVE